MPTAPPHFTKGELAIWEKSVVLLNNLFDELRENGFLRPQREMNREELRQMDLIFQRITKRFSANNAINRAIRDKNLREKLESFLLSLDIGFEPGDLNDMWGYLYFGAYVEDTELMRKNLLIVLRSKGRVHFRQRMTLGQLIQAIRENCPKHGAAFADSIDVPLRNAIAHGLYWFSQYFSRYYIEYCKELGATPRPEGFYDLLIRMRKYNILNACLNATLLEKFKAGWFNFGAILNGHVNR